MSPDNIVFSAFLEIEITDGIFIFYKYQVVIVFFFFDISVVRKHILLYNTYVADNIYFQLFWNLKLRTVNTHLLQESMS